jgi:glycine cleavage system transcriptional repressor
MLLAITVLGNHSTRIIAEILPAISDSKCSVLELRSSKLALSTAAYLLVQGNWNQIAKLENILEIMQRRMEIKIHTFRPEQKDLNKTFMPYSLETISLDRDHIIESIISFLTDREIEIEDVVGSAYLAPYVQSTLFSSKFIILIPPQLNLLALREEFLDFCDQLNIDAIFEPLKR